MAPKWQNCHKSRFLGQRRVRRELLDNSMKSASVVRGAALLIALVAIAGLCIDFVAVSAWTDSAIMTGWALLRYFTITTNLLVAWAFLSVAVSGSAHAAPKLMGATVLSILLVGVVYALLLSGRRELSGGSLIADVLLHRITPVLVPLFWLWLVPKGHLSRRDPFVWALYPLGYFAYALVRGAAEGRYAYPFMNPVALGWPRTGFNAVAIAVGFFVAGEVLLWVDRRLRTRVVE
jgi:hypothetical protein